MKTGYREVLLAACMTIAAFARGAAAPDAVVLDEVDVSSVKDRERESVLYRYVSADYVINVHRKGVTAFKLEFRGPPRRGLPTEIHFRRQSSARRLAPESVNSTRPGQGPQLSGDRVIAAQNKSLTSASLVLDASVDEADGLPASIPFGPKASLVNLDHVRLREVPDGMGIEVANAIHPVTRRCGRQYVLYDEGSAFPNRFVLLADSIAACRDVQGGREGDLVVAATVPGQLRQAVREVYDPVASRIASRLGSEVGLVFVAMWPESPHTGYRFEPSWGRNSLLLFNGPEWQKGLGPEQRDALSSVFVTEQIRRRIGRSDSMDPFSESAARYLEGLLTREQAGGTNQWLADALPGWISGCDRTLQNPARVAAARGNVPSVDCGLLVQFVYDAVARAGSGDSSLYDIWRSLLSKSYRRGESGAHPTDFLAASAQAQRIVQGLLDGVVDWTGFATELTTHGVRLSVNQDASGISVSVLSLNHFPD